MIAGSTVWITGGSSGIGAALASEMASRGARVAITAPDPDGLLEVARAAPGQVEPVAGDVRDGEAMLELAGRVQAQLGPIDIAVLNAGIWEQFDVRRWDSAPIRRHIETNLLGMVNTLDAVVPAMLARGSGRIVGVASVAGYRGYTGAEAYGTTKAAEISLLESLRIDLAPHGVVVQTVNPGFVDTPLTRQNEFPMPFMTDVVTAATRIADGIERGKAEIVFPLPYLIGMKLVGLVPVRMYTGVSSLVRRWSLWREERAA